MSFLELCRRRQSTRRYDPARPVPREAVERCLEAARLAPSACNSQPWGFSVVDAEPLRTQLAAAAFSHVYAMNRFAREAPVLIVVTTEPSKPAAQLAGRLRGVPYNLVDVGIAVEHLVLQAEEEGLGSCWLGWFDAPAVRRVLGLPRAARVDLMVSLGYAAEPALRTKVRKPLSAIARFNLEKGGM